MTLDDAGPRFVAMTPTQRQLFLAIYVHEITILARVYFLEQRFDSARLCNETMHRIAGYMASLLRNPNPVVDTSFIEALVAGAVHKGWGNILLRAMEISA